MANDFEKAVVDAVREIQQQEINAANADREALEAQYGEVWSTEEMAQEFEVIGFLAPYVVVRRKSDGKEGSLMFQHHPRYYFSWQENR